VVVSTEGGAGPHGRAPIRAVTLDYWDTLYTGVDRVERMAVRREAVGRLFAAYGHALTAEELAERYREAGAEADRWWREGRGYRSEERLRWALARAGIEPPPGCVHVAHAVRAVDEALLEHRAPLLDGAVEGVRALASRVRLAIVSDTGFSSGEAQDRLLAQDGLLDHFAARIYSCDVGHSKPHPTTFRAALDALGVEPHEALHVGDIERTDIAGALGVGMRAVRLDAVRDGGPSAAEHVARSWAELLEYVEGVMGDA
jgi:putative hydrolase of the HAD superfamily